MQNLHDGVHALIAAENEEPDVEPVAVVEVPPATEAPVEAVPSEIVAEVPAVVQAVAEEEPPAADAEPPVEAEAEAPEEDKPAAE